MSSSLGGTSGFSRTADVGVPSRMALKMTPELSPRNGSVPVAISYKHCAEGKQIGAGIQFFGSHLFRRHISDGAERSTGAGQVLLAHRRLLGRCSRRFHHSAANWRHFRQPKIQNLGVSALGDEDVGRLDVAVDDAFGVGGVERVGNLDGQSEQ